VDHVARAAAVVLTERDEDGANYELTGPEALSMTDMAGVWTRVGVTVLDRTGRGGVIQDERPGRLGRAITYNDMPEDDFRRLLVDQGGIPSDEVDIKAILHLRAWRNGDADLVTDTYRALTGEAPLSLSEWVAAHRDAFEAPQVPAPAGTD
jgi:hypothetical protein